MALITPSKAPASRTDSGKKVLDAAKGVDTTRVKARLQGFARAHKAYAAAEGKVRRADAALRSVQEKVAAADVAQDEAVEKLADALVGAGLPRKNPFAPLGFEAPAAIMKMGYEKEAKRVKDLAAKVAGRKDLAKAHAAAARAAKAAKAVTAALAKVPAAEAKRTAAITVRDGLAQPWETAWKALKNAARTAEDDGATGLFDALFVHKEAGTRTSGGGGAAGTPGSGTPPGSSPV